MQNLKSGYYLSIYTDINKHLNSLKNSLRHDHNMSLWKLDRTSLRLIHHWEFERTTGIKHHEVSFPSQEISIEFINMLLKQYDLSADDMEAIFGTPIISTVDDYYNKDLGPEMTYHAISHLFTSLLMDTDIFYNEDILALSLDGGADCLIDNDDYQNRYDFLCGYSSKGKINYFPIPSPGRYWIELKQITGLEEGTLMALATATSCKTLETICEENELIKVYRYLEDSPAKVVKKIHDRILSYTHNDLGQKYTGYDKKFTENENKISMMAKYIQEISIKQVCDVIDKVIEKYQIDPSKVNLSLSGGYALNCPTNTYLMHKYRFKRQLISPCINDGGQALGMGLYYFYKKNQKIDFKLHHPFYGNKDERIELLHANPYKDFIASIDDTLEYFTKDILNAPIVWFDGHAEIGPRALGQRSILADPCNPKSKILLNQYKQRQWWRPVAPIILFEELDTWFQDAFESPFMLNNFILRDEKVDMVPAIIHLDQTARVQTIDKSINENLYRCIKQYFDITGIPIICNTSLNDRGEPIVDTIEDALNFALRKKIEIVYINCVRVQLHNHESFFAKTPRKRNDIHFTKTYTKTKMKISASECLLYYATPKLHVYDLDNEEDLNILKPILKKMMIVNNMQEFSQ